jgi:hypothetical protein
MGRLGHYGVNFHLIPIALPDRSSFKVIFVVDFDSAPLKALYQGGHLALYST